MEIKPHDCAWQDSIAAYDCLSRNKSLNFIKEGPALRVPPALRLSRLDYFTVILHFAVFPLVVFAVIVAFPFFFAVTFPFLMAATFLLDVFQVTLSVELEGVSFAFSLTDLPFFNVTFDLESFTFFAGILTVILIVAFFPLVVVTVMVAVPLPMPFTLPELVTVAIFLLLDFQESLSVELEGVVTAFNVIVLPLFNDLEAGFFIITFVAGIVLTGSVTVRL